MMWGRPAPLLGRPACYLPLYKSHSFLAALGLQHNTILAPEFIIPFQNFVVEFLLGSSIGVKRVRGNLGVKVVLKS